MVVVVYTAKLLFTVHSLQPYLTPTNRLSKNSTDTIMINLDKMITYMLDILGREVFNVLIGIHRSIIGQKE